MNIRKNAYAATAAVHLINARVVEISDSNEGKNLFGFEQKSHSTPSREVRNVQHHSDANTSRDMRL